LAMQSYSFITTKQRIAVGRFLGSLFGGKSIISTEREC